MLGNAWLKGRGGYVVCDEKSRALRRGGKRRKKRGRKRGVRGTAEREIEHEYVGLVLPAHEDEGRRTGEERKRAQEGESDEEGKRGEKRERERSAAVALLLSFNPAAFLCSFQPACPPPV